MSPINLTDTTQRRLLQSIVEVARSTADNLLTNGSSAVGVGHA